MSPDYSALDSFVTPARPRSEPWRAVLGVLLIFVAHSLLLSLCYLFAISLLPKHLAGGLLQQAGDDTQPLGMLVLLASFFSLILAVTLVTRHLHDRSFQTLFGPLTSLVRQFKVTTKWLLVIFFLIWILPPTEFGIALTQAKPFVQWLFLLLPAIPLLLVQSGAEELLFRGYLQQQLAARFDSPWFWMVLPALVFGLLHYRSDIGASAWLIVGWAMAFSIAAADLTARAGTLGPALALHFVSNCFAILLVSHDAEMTGLALYTAPMDLTDITQMRRFVMIDLGILFVGWLAARVAIRT